MILHTAYILICLLLIVKSENPDASISDKEEVKENTLFPKNGPVFMRKLYSFDRSYPYRTEPTVVFLNGTFSHQIYKIVEITKNVATTSTTAGTSKPPNVDFEQIQNNEVYDNQNPEMSSESAISEDPNDLSVLSTSTDSIQTKMVLPDATIVNKYDLVTANADVADASTTVNDYDVVTINADTSTIVNEYDLVTSNADTTISKPINVPFDKNILRSSLDSSIPLNKNILRSNLDSSLPSELYTETSNPLVGASYLSIITSSTPSTIDTFYPISGAIEQRINPEAFLKLPLSDIVWTPQKMMRPMDPDNEQGPKQAIFVSKDKATIEVDVTPKDVFRTEHEPEEVEPKIIGEEEENLLRTAKEYMPERFEIEPTLSQLDMKLANMARAATAPRFDVKEEPKRNQGDIRPEDFVRTGIEKKSDIESKDETTISRFEPKTEYTQTTPLGLKETNQVITDVKEMEAETDPFSVFLKKLLMILSSKNVNDLPKLIKPLERYLIMIVDSGKLMKLGSSTSSYIAQEIPLLKAPTSDLQRQMFVAQVSLQYRRRMLSEDVNDILDEMDDVYDVDEEDTMQRVLNEIKLFPNISKTADDIVKDFIDGVFIRPMHRIAGTARGKIIFDHISNVTSKYIKPYVMARRFEKNEDSSIYESSRNEESYDVNKFVGRGKSSDHRNHKINDRQMDSKNKPLVVEVLVKDRQRNNRKRRVKINPEPVLVSKVPYNARRFRTKIFNGGEVRSRKSKGVDIKIKIRNLKDTYYK